MRALWRDSTRIIAKVKHYLVATCVNDLLKRDAELLCRNIGEFVERNVVNAIPRGCFKLLCRYRGKFNLGANNREITWRSSARTNGDDDRRPLRTTNLQHSLVN